MRRSVSRAARACVSALTSYWRPPESGRRQSGTHGLLWSMAAPIRRIAPCGRLRHQLTMPEAVEASLPSWCCCGVVLAGVQQQLAEAGTLRATADSCASTGNSNLHAWTAKKMDCDESIASRRHLKSRAPWPNAFLPPRRPVACQRGMQVEACTSRPNNPSLTRAKTKQARLPLSDHVYYHRVHLRILPLTVSTVDAAAGAAADDQDSQQPQHPRSRTEESSRISRSIARAAQLAYGSAFAAAQNIGCARAGTDLRADLVQSGLQHNTNNPSRNNPTGSTGAALRRCRSSRGSQANNTTYR